jgi:flavorubredoxin
MSIKIRRIFSLCLAALLLCGMGMSHMVYATNNVKQALIVVDPGFSQFSLTIAQNIADKLAQKSISVKLIKVNQFKTQDISGVDLLVLGGPTYMAQPSNGLKKFVSTLNITSGINTLLFQTGGTDCGGLAPLAELVKTKGLQVIGSCGILKPKGASEIENKISKLLENI